MRKIYEKFKVCKFGGSSVADAKAFERVKNIVLGDKKRLVVVVSAPGKRFESDDKVTDLLYALTDKLYKKSDDGYFDFAFGRFFCLREKLRLKTDVRAEIQIIKRNAFKGVDYIVSRGEYLCAKMAAEYLGYTFIDAKDLFFFNESGRIDEKKTRDRIKKLDLFGGVVVPGFYGSAANGTIKVFPRGGSDVSGALLAAYLTAEEYENWTDVSGVYQADPRIKSGQTPIKNMTYRELKAVCVGGAQVICAGAIPPLEQCGVTLRILNTFHPEEDGTTVK